MIFVLKKRVIEALKYLPWVLQSQPAAHLRGNTDVITQPCWVETVPTPLPLSPPSLK